ncbi:hypothetical protein WA588_000825, partial [Blastocystis sp. NMH]
MGCGASKTEFQLKGIQKWEYTENGVKKTLTKNDLERLRKEFWEKEHEGNPAVWAVLKKCCEEVLNGNFEKANHILFSNDLTLVSGELNSVADANGVTYTVEKYCYSNPSNMETDIAEGGVEGADAKGNNKFRFRVGASFLDEEREVIFVFDDKAHPEAIDTPKEHSPENHIFFHTYHYSDDLNTITEEQVRNKMLEVIQNFPEVKGKLVITHVRMFYLGHELNRPTPFVRNHIPFDSVIIVMAQCE